MTSLLWKGQMRALTSRALGAGAGAGAAKASKADVEAQVGSPVEHPCPLQEKLLCCCLPLMHAKQWRQCEP